MATRCAVCRDSDGLVINIIMASADDIPPDGCYLIEILEDQLCDIGWTYDGTTFVPPPEEVTSGD